MKSTYFPILIGLCLFFACDVSVEQESSDRLPQSATRDFQNDAEKAAYAYGITQGRNIVIDPIIKHLPREEILLGIQDMTSEQKPVMTLEESRAFLVEYFGKISAEQGEKNLAESEAFLEKNAKKPGIISLESGLQYQVIKEGKGAHPLSTSTVVVHYDAKMLNGETFDSSFVNPINEFPLGATIQAWQEVIPLMQREAKYKLFVPPHLAYGNKPMGKLEPNSLLIFDLELIDIK